MAPERTVYLVDDDPAIRRSLERLLGTADFRVVSYATPTEFLDAATGLPVGCVLLDLRMPEMNGLEVLRHLRKEENTVQIILLSNHSDTSYVDAALEMGANGYVGKDSGFDVLMLAIEAIREGVSYIDPKIPRRAA